MAISSNLGYPRIGSQRQWKKAIEKYWAGKLDEAALHQELTAIRLEHLRKQKEAGIALIPLNDFTYYDHVLDTAVMLGIVPTRFNYAGGKVTTKLYYEIARGSKEQPASEMTKWFNTNYHYIVPELQHATPQLTINAPLEAFREAKRELDIEGKPVILGLFSFIKLSKGYRAADTRYWVDQLLPLYCTILQELEQEGAAWVQLDEPSFVISITDEELDCIRYIYHTLSKAAPKLNILLQTYFDSVERYKDIIELPIAGLGIDGVHGWEGNLAQLQAHGVPQHKWLAIGLVDGRNIWRTNIQEAGVKLEQLLQLVQDERLIIQPSCSLLHVPVTVADETKLAEEIKQVLAFADEKLSEVVRLTDYSNGQTENWEQSCAAVEEAYNAFDRIKQRKHGQELSEILDELSEKGLSRSVSFNERYLLQLQKHQLPLLPTTTIGSFPQTSQVRAARSRWRKGEWTTETYDAFIAEEINRWIVHQEELGLDVLVHGEFERTDMVEFFGEKLGGFCFTTNGWVQSYGSRCVKPPIIYGDVTYCEPMTVKETVYAQSRTSKPVKGMLTGPITIMNWSFIRQDISKDKIAFQLAYALRQEVKALEDSGICIIQVDEPAVREGLPLKAAAQESYLKTAIDAFKLTTSVVKSDTQIHTHMCYCDFHEMIASIRAMDADVISIETSRSHGELIHSFEQQTYDLGIGLGVYDIHSPRVPSADEMVALIERALHVLDARLFWINPDCGLKTRGETETIAALKQMIQATLTVRTKLLSGALQQS